MRMITWYILLLAKSYPKRQQDTPECKGVKNKRRRLRKGHPCFVESGESAYSRKLRDARLTGDHIGISTSTECWTDLHARADMIKDGSILYENADFDTQQRESENQAYIDTLVSHTPKAAR